MKRYAKIYIECTSKKEEDKQVYKEFKERMKKYLIDRDMELYRIPILSEDYRYAQELAKKYVRDFTKPDECDDIPGLYVDKKRVIETDYTKKDYEQAVAYLVNFWYLVFPYEDTEDDEFNENCCEKPDWKYKTAMIQKRKCLLPSTEFKKKKYAKLMSGYVLAEEARNMLLEHGLATEEDFWEVTNRKGGIVCYQIMPKNVIHGFAKDNNMKLVDKCKHCGMERYWFYEEPYHMSQETLDQLAGLNQTIERDGGSFDEEELKRQILKGADMRTAMEPWYILNKDAYNLLHKHYPRMQFIPIFLKEEKE